MKHDVVNLGYHLRDIGRAAVIGVGGGRDILAAITFGVPKITGIEINPAIFEALDNTFAEFTGNLSQHPAVNLVNAEARSYLYSDPDTYDMIQISLIDTWAATAAGGLTLSENKLYTLEAWKEFLKRLNDGGMLTVSRWFVSRLHEGELYRLLSLATDALRETRAGSKPHLHVMAASTHDVINVMVSNTPFTKAYLGTFHDDAQVQKLLNQALAKPLSVRQENLREIRNLPDDAPAWLKRKWPEGGPYHRFEPDNQLHDQVRHIADWITNFRRGL